MENRQHQRAFWNQEFLRQFTIIKATIRRVSGKVKTGFQTLCLWHQNFIWLIWRWTNFTVKVNRINYTWCSQTSSKNFEHKFPVWYWRINSGKTDANRNQLTSEWNDRAVRQYWMSAHYFSKGISKMHLVSIYSTIQHNPQDFWRIKQITLLIATSNINLVCTHSREITVQFALYLNINNFSKQQSFIHKKQEERK